MLLARTMKAWRKPNDVPLPCFYDVNDIYRCNELSRDVCAFTTCMLLMCMHLRALATTPCTIICRIRHRRIDTSHEDAFDIVLVHLHVAQRPSHSERPGTRVFICVHLLAPLFIQVHREMTPRNIFRGIKNPRIIVKGDSATQRRLFPFSYYNATTSIAAYDLHPSRGSAISSGWFYELTASPCRLKFTIDFKCKVAFVARMYAKM